MRQHVTLFRISTGENWHRIMFDTTRDKSYNCIEGDSCGSSNYFNLLVLNVFYFISFIIIAQYTMLNLFILILMQ